MNRRIKYLLPHDFWSILILGLLLRLLVMPFTLNWDLLANTRLIATWNTLPLAEFYKQPLAAYPPLIYSILNTVLVITGKIFGYDFWNWLHATDLALLTHQHTFRYLFFLKLPFVCIEVLTGILFSRLFARPLQNRALMLWLLNPLIIFTVSIWTSVDIIPVALLIVSLYLAKHNRFILAAAALGFGGALKLFPLFVFPLLFIQVSGWRRKAQVTVAALLPFLLAHLPVLTLPAYWQHTATGGYSDQVFFASLPIGPDRSLIFYYFFYTLILFYFNQFTSKNQRPLIFFSFFVFLPLFIFSRFNLQWILWIAPLLILVSLQNNVRKLPLFNIGMLAPLEPTFWLLDWPVKQKLGTEMTMRLLNGLQSIFAASLIWLIYAKLRLGGMREGSQN
ncbi:MAG: hypothetical protein UV59_C0035G0012 [Candidatus Gottesmanbacteria bacterium GW2011_GWA1_43_11]|uniref:DUF2029 domain-containing protein n=1 Tax=Candidatus Gottesmanbacteria bacterium GW2011_GWA1_43_11 TaxID=1618436 RepID=A0A0G1CD99_9BACT|nr:MAG: hypothetical protein UV59_C0035G0012 [Candidatus Gottesmanbacteria bacterium GW2011_GWA1_43_11]